MFVFPFETPVSQSEDVKLEVCKVCDEIQRHKNPPIIVKKHFPKPVMAHKILLHLPRDICRISDDTQRWKMKMSSVKITLPIRVSGKKLRTTFWCH